MGCPFGCAETHRKQQSNLRSIAHNRSEEGRNKKKDLNNKRPKPGIPAAPIAPVAPAIPAVPPRTVPQEKEPPSWPVPVVMYVQLVTSWIEDRRVSVQEVLEMLAKVLRQHRMVRRRWIDQIMDWLNEHPP